jgi:hypothetical protein
VHGPEPSDRALKAAHGEVLGRVLRTPLNSLVEDLRESSQESAVSSETFVQGMCGQLNELLPAQQDEASVRHLNSVLVALSSLEKSRERATRSTS